MRAPDALAALRTPTWRDVAFGALLQWLAFVPLLGVLLTLAHLPQPGATELLIGLYSGLYSAPVGAIVTVVLGVPLARLLAHTLRSVASWKAHLGAFLGLGFILAVVLIHAWMLSQGYLFDGAAWWTSLAIFVPISSAAALSVGAGWALAWLRAVRAQQKLLELLEG